ncbi:hypothetical protein EEB14_52510 [Rhodococcus sp. WS4]|nr:hypothetical protein EEB14_52510 [Rhodococcus sp. WS4]
MDVRRIPQARSENYWEQQCLAEARHVDCAERDRHPVDPDEHVSLVDHCRVAPTDPDSRGDREYTKGTWAAG